MIEKLLDALLAFASITGYSAEATEVKDVEAEIAQPNEANLEALITQAEAVVEHLDKNVPVATVQACGVVGIGLVSFAYNPSLKGGTLLGGEIATQLPIINPKWGKVSAQHWQDLTNALTAIESDFGA